MIQQKKRTKTNPVKTDNEDTKRNLPKGDLIKAILNHEKRKAKVKPKNQETYRENDFIID